MTYKKPELTLIGDALSMIQGKQTGAMDGSQDFTIASSYELDEE